MWLTCSAWKNWAIFKDLLACCVRQSYCLRLYHEPNHHGSFTAHLSAWWWQINLTSLLLPLYCATLCTWAMRQGLGMLKSSVYIVVPRSCDLVARDRGFARHDAPWVLLPWTHQSHWERDQASELVYRFSRIKVNPNKLICSDTFWHIWQNSWNIQEVCYCHMTNLL